MSAEAEDPAAAFEAMPPTSLAAQDKVLAHLAKVAALLFEEESEGGVEEALAQSPDAVNKFIADSHCKTLLVEKYVGKEEEEGDEGDAAVASHVESQR